MKNIDIREAISKAGLRHWQVAEVYGCADGNFSRKLRKELSQKDKDRIFAIIEKLAKEVS